MTGGASANNGLPFTVHRPLPEMHDATMVMMLTGWIDASAAAAGALEACVSQLQPELLVTFDADTFVDYRARRPTMHLRDGLNTSITWSTPEIHVAHDSEDNDVVLLVGPEPDTAWHLFARTVTALCAQLGVTRVIGLGAYPFAAPHTRPVGLSCTTANAELLAALPHSRNSIDVPAGVQAVIEHSLFESGIDSFGLWAQVPHYVSSMAYPAASAALIDALCAHAHVALDSGELRREAAIQRERLDQLVAGNTEHSAMLRQLEAAYDALHRPALPASDFGSSGDRNNGQTLDATFGTLPTMDELAAEVEQFLRDQRQGGTS